MTVMETLAIVRSEKSLQKCLAIQRKFQLTPKSQQTQMSPKLMALIKAGRVKLTRRKIPTAVRTESPLETMQPIESVSNEPATSNVHDTSTTVRSSEYDI